MDRSSVSRLIRCLTRPLRPSARTAAALLRLRCSGRMRFGTANTGARRSSGAVAHAVECSCIPSLWRRPAKRFPVAISFLVTRGATENSVEIAADGRGVAPCTPGACTAGAPAAALLFSCRSVDMDSLTSHPLLNCPACGGAGKLDARRCLVCAGRGWTTRTCRGRGVFLIEHPLTAGWTPAAKFLAECRGCSHHQCPKRKA